MGAERVAGVVFHLEEAKLKEAAEGFSGHALLSAQVTDIELWQAMVDQLTEGLPLYRGKDFKSQLIQVLQEDQEALKTASERKVQELTAELERTRQTVNQLYMELGEARKLVIEQQAFIGQLSGQSDEILRTAQELAAIADESLKPK